MRWPIGITPKPIAGVVDIDVEGKGDTSLDEILKTNIIEHKTHKLIDGIVGLYFSSMCAIMISVYTYSSYGAKINLVFPMILVSCMANYFSILQSETYRERKRQTMVCLSVLIAKSIAENQHPVLVLNTNPMSPR